MGFIYCKDYPKENISLSENLLALFHHGDFIGFEADYSMETDTYIIHYANIDYVAVRYEMGTLNMHNFGQSNKKLSNYVVCLFLTFNNLFKKIKL